LPQIRVLALGKQTWFGRNISVLRRMKPNMLGYAEKTSWHWGVGREIFVRDVVWAHQDSNLGPSDYESDALTN
jgi:hypothetical protein